MPEITADDVTKIAKDALFVGVGAGVIAFQKAQVQRVQLTEAVTTQVEELRSRLEAAFGAIDVDGRVKLVEERLDSVEERVEAILDDLEAKLPEQAREVVKQARETARDAREQVRAAVGRAA
jgi:paraquat-inducible protein B